MLGRSCKRNHKEGWKVGRKGWNYKENRGWEWIYAIQVELKRWKSIVITWRRTYGRVGIWGRKYRREQEWTAQ